MKYFIYTFILLLSLNSFSQEKRLALVIGNSDYEKGQLKNPVNDAKLIAKTLDSLGFDVIAKYNLATQLEFKNAIKEFGTRRENYEVGFVYYAGHGIQVNDENFMLPTKVSFNSEIDVQEDGVSVKSIMRYLESKSSQVNILILDACRDIPFETTWKKTRSVKGEGLAKLLPPSGSLIAFSTEPGNTAADGDKENSIYCISLAKNLKLENTSLDQVFRNVRREVLETSNNFQRPIEASQLTGSTFYLVKSNFSKEFDKIESLISNNKNNEAKTLINSIILKESNNKRAYKLLGDNYFVQKNFELAIESYNTAIKIDTNYIPAITQKTKVFEEIGNNYGSLGDYQKQNEYYMKSLNEINRLIILDDNNKDLYNRRGIIYYYYLNDTINALNDFNKSIQIDPFFIKAYINRANLYSEREKEKALNDYNKAISLIPNSNELSKLNIAISYECIAAFNFENNDLNSALIYFTKAIESDPQYDKPYLRRAKVYKAQNDTINSEIDLNKYIELQPLTMAGFANKRDAYIEFDQIDKAIICLTNIILYLPNSATNYNTRGTLYEKINQFEKALADYNKAIELEPKESTWLFNRALLFQNYLEKYDNALSDYIRVIEMNPKDSNAYNNVALLYKNNIKNNEKALEYFNKNIELAPTEPLGYSNRGDFYQSELNQFDKALEDCNKAIEMDPNNSDWLLNRALLYQDKLEQFDKALSDYLKIIEMNPSESNSYNNIAVLYEFYLKNYEKALEFYNKKIELSPKDPSGYNNRGKLYDSKFNDNDKALINYDKAIELDSENSSYYNDRGQFFEKKLMKFDKALEDYNKAIEYDSNNSDWIFARGYLYHYSLEKFENAISDYMRVIELKGNYSGSAYTNIGNIYCDELKKYDKALEFYNKKIELNVQDPLGYNNRASLYRYNLKDNEKAILDYNKAIELASDNASYYNDRGLFYEFELKEYDKALADYNKAIELEPKEILWLVNRANLFENKIKQFDKALIDYNKAIELEPMSTKYYNLRAIFYRKKTKQFDLALQDYNKVIELEPKVSSYYSNRAILEFFDLNLKDKAYEDYKKAIELAPDLIYNYLYRIKSFMFMEDFENAEKDINKTIAIDKNDPEGYYDLALIYKKQKKYLQSLIQVSKAIDLILDSNYTIIDDKIIDNLGIEDLYVFRAELFKLFQDKGGECEDYNLALQSIKDNTIKKENIELLIKENCK